MPASSAAAAMRPAPVARPARAHGSGVGRNLGQCPARSAAAAQPHGAQLYGDMGRNPAVLADQMPPAVPGLVVAAARRSRQSSATANRQSRFRSPASDSASARVSASPGSVRLPSAPRGQNGLRATSQTWPSGHPPNSRNSRPRTPAAGAFRPVPPAAKSGRIGGVDLGLGGEILRQRHAPVPSIAPGPPLIGRQIGPPNSASTCAVHLIEGHARLAVAMLHPAQPAHRRRAPPADRPRQG
jgi:hypothetical protein